MKFLRWKRANPNLQTCKRANLLICRFADLPICMAVAFAFALLFVSVSGALADDTLIGSDEASAQDSGEADAMRVPQARSRPTIVDSVRPVFLPKITKLEIVSDRAIKIKQMKLSKGGVLRIEMFNATTSLPDSISIDKGILRGIAFETEGDELRLYISLSEPVLYDVESTDRGIVVEFQNPVLEQLISLNVNSEPITTVLLMLFIEYGANIIAGSDVSGTVTAHLVDVPLKAALDEILGAEGYGYVEEGGLIRVMKADQLIEMQTAEASPMTSLAQIKLETRLFQLKFAGVNDMKPILEELLGQESNILADPRTNSIIVISTEQNLAQVADIISQLDKEIEIPVMTAANGQDQMSQMGVPAGQETVVIAPEIIKKTFKLNYVSPEKASAILQPFLSSEGAIEVIEEKRESSGASGGAGGSRGGAGMSGGMGSSGGAGSTMQLGEAVGRGGYIVVSDREEVMEAIEEEIDKIDIPIPQVEIEAYIVEGALSDDNDLGIDWTAVSTNDEMQFAFSGDVGGILSKGIITAEKFAGILNALATNSKLNVLSNPRITTLEDQPAIFHSGDKVPYNRIVIQDGIQQVDTVFEDVGIVLTATPQVKEDGIVSLLIATSVSSEGGFTPSGQPRISTRTTQSQVMVKTGDTAIIAGLISEKSSTAVSKVPIIGDIPLIGRIFSTERDVKQKSEVTIFITPRIIP